MRRLKIATNHWNSSTCLSDLDHDDEYALEIEMRARDCYEGDANL